MKSGMFRAAAALCTVVALVVMPAGSPVFAQGKGTIKIATQSPLSELRFTTYHGPMKWRMR